MSAKKDRPEAPHLEPAESITNIASLGHREAIASACEAYVALVLTPKGKFTRRVFLSLHGANQAVERARARGQAAAVVLCRLTPEYGQPNLSRWSA